MDTAERPSPRRAGRGMGAYAPMVLLLLLAAFAIEEGLRLLLVVDPAAQADMAGWYVLGLGVILAGTSIVAERPKANGSDGTPADSGDGAAEAEYTRPRTPRRDMAACLVLFAVYATLLGTVGYVIAGVVVVFGFLRVIADYTWIRTTVYTVAINAVSIAMFELSGVVLPSGILQL